MYFGLPKKRSEKARVGLYLIRLHATLIFSKRRKFLQNYTVNYLILIFGYRTSTWGWAASVFCWAITLLINYCSCSTMSVNLVACMTAARFIHQLVTSTNAFGVHCQWTTTISTHPSAERLRSKTVACKTMIK